MKKIIPIIKQNQLFVNLTEDEMLKALQCLSAKTAEYDRDNYILMVGDDVSNIGIVISGSANVIKEDFWGNRAIIYKISHGGLFGEAFCCAGIKKSHISVVACEKTEVLFLNFKKLKKTCDKNCRHHGILIQNMMKLLAKKDIILTQKIDVLTKRTLRDKIFAYLSSEAMTANSNTFEIPFNRQELADYLSVDRSALSKELGRLRDEGIINFYKNRFELFV